MGVYVCVCVCVCVGGCGCGCVCMCVCVCGCVHNNLPNILTSQPIALEDELTAANDEYAKEWAEQDAEGVGAFYTWDAKIMATGMDNIHGREGI